MKTTVLALLAVAWGGLSARADLVDRVDDALTFSSADGVVRGRISGSLDLEAYQFTTPPPALIDSRGSALFNPQLTTFFDGQIGSTVYMFAQARVDRGFDPANEPLQARLDEYALRLTPGPDDRVNVQIGKFATVVGNWVPRHLAWDNPLINAPLVYENLTGIWDAVPASSVGTVLSWAHLRGPPPHLDVESDKYLRIPVIWGPSYATGAAVSGEFGRFTYAGEIKATSLSSRPDTWPTNVLPSRHPTVSARIAYRPNMAWEWGFSASTGVYLKPEAASLLPPGRGLGEYRETVLGQDVSFAWHHVQVWAEAYEARFAIPRVGDADTYSYYVETRYKFTPQFFGALRWNEQFFGRLPDPAGGSVRWGADTWRADAALGYRFTPHTELKLQYSFQHTWPASPATAHLLGLQFVLRF